MVKNWDKFHEALWCQTGYPETDFSLWTSQQLKGEGVGLKDSQSGNRKHISFSPPLPHPASTHPPY